MTADADGGNRSGLAAGTHGHDVVRRRRSVVVARRQVALRHAGQRRRRVPHAAGHRRRRDRRRSDTLGRQTWVDVGRTLWLPDGNGLLFAARERPVGASQFWIARYPGGQATRMTNDARGFGDISVSVTADGSTIATVPGDHRQQPLQHERRCAPRRSNSGRRACGWTAGPAIAPSADGPRVFTSADGIDVHLERRCAGRAAAPADPQTRRSPVTPADGRFVVFQAIHEGRFRIWRMQPDGTDARVLSRGEDDVSPMVSPDGKWIYYEAAEQDTRPDADCLLKVETRRGWASAWPIRWTSRRDGRELLIRDRRRSPGASIRRHGRGDRRDQSPRSTFQAVVRAGAASLASSSTSTRRTAWTTCGSGRSPAAPRSS